MSAAQSPDFWVAVQPHVPSVHHFLRRLGVPEADLEDLTHDTLCEVLDRWSEYDTARPVLPWVLGFAFRQVVKVRRRKRFYAERGGLEEEQHAVESESPEAYVQRVEARSLALEALESLPVERRAVFVLMELHDLSAPETAQALEVPLNTVYSRLRAARVEFDEALRRSKLRRGLP